MTIPGSERYVPEGQAYIFGLNQEMARRVLDATVQAGYPTNIVRTGDDGFYVPAEVVDIIYPHQPETQEGKP